MQAADARERATPQETLAVQRRAWAERPLVRDLYRSWFRRVERRLSRVEGPTVELGSGIGTFKEFMPDVVATDVVPTEWAGSPPPSRTARPPRGSSGAHSTTNAWI